MKPIADLFTLKQALSRCGDLKLRHVATGITCTGRQFMDGMDETPPIFRLQRGRAYQVLDDRGNPIYVQCFRSGNRGTTAN